MVAITEITVKEFDKNIKVGDVICLLPDKIWLVVRNGGIPVIFVDEKGVVSKVYDLMPFKKPVPPTRIEGA
jgi:hypothetical protein